MRKAGGGRRKYRAPVYRAGDRRHETIASPSQRRDVPRAVPSIAKRLAKAGDVKPQTAFFHGDASPDTGQQLFFADRLVGTGQQNNQNFQGAPAQSHGGASLCKKPLVYGKAERTKRYDLFRPRRRRRHGVVSPSRPTPCEGSGPHNTHCRLLGCHASPSNAIRELLLLARANISSQIITSNSSNLIIIFWSVSRLMSS